MREILHGTQSVQVHDFECIWRPCRHCAALLSSVNQDTSLRTGTHPSIARGRSNEAYTGALGGIRTHDLQLRRLTLYPAELRAR